MILKNRFLFTICLAIIPAILLLASGANAQRRDYLTEAEIELVRDAQEIDLRIAVLTKAIDRRFAVVEKKTIKEKEIWGPLPAGTQLELFTDIERLLGKAIDDIDNVADRNRDSKLFPKAVHKLADACTAYLPKFKTFIEATEDQKVRGALLGSVTNCENVLEAANGMVRENPK